MRSIFPGQIAIFFLASAVAIPALAQSGAPRETPGDSSSQEMQTATPQNTPPSSAQQQSLSVTGSQLQPPKEGFWGRMNPFARKKWVKKQTDAINDRLGELDEVNAKNANDIRDVDSRSQAGIRRAQSAADAANQAATAAGQQALMAGNTANAAGNHVDRLKSTVNGLDQYRQVTEADIAFRSGSPILSAAAKKQLDDLAATVTGQQGYILEVEAHSPAAGSVGIQSSERLAESVKRYLVTEHQIPVYRMHAVALGNAQVAATGDEDARPVRVRTSTVHIRLMENSLAAQEVAPPQGVASSDGAERP
jgi:outer membrane protein OmpA-like peptidoglycan-associated protein